MAVDRTDRSFVREITDGNLSLHHLDAFRMTMESGRVAAAGEKLRRSPSAISRSIAILEEKFGCTLAMRAHDGISPSPEGELVAARCDIIQSELDDLRHQLTQAHGDSLHANASTFQMHVDVSRIRAVIAVHDFGSVQRACKSLSISQPGVSATLRHLEEDLGIELFSRTPTGMVPTLAGVISTLSFKRILSELRKMKDDIDSFAGEPSGLVCVGGLAFSRSALLPEAISRTQNRYPQILLRTVEGPIHALISAMHAGDIDILICAQPDPTLLEGVDIEPIVTDDMNLYVSKDHPLARRKKLSAEDLLDHAFILPPQNTITRDMLDCVFAKETGAMPSGAVETSSYAVIRYLLLHSELISFRSIKEFHADLPTGNIVALDLDFALPKRQICLLQRTGVKRTAAVTEFLEIVRQISVKV